MTAPVAYRSRVYDSYRSGQGTSQSDDRRARAPYLRRIIHRHFPSDRGSKILDLGCGSGTVLHYLLEAGYRDVTGVDFSPQQVDAARILGISEVRRGDLYEALRECVDAEYDVVIAFDVIEHQTKAELLEFADEVFRVLKPQGRWLIHAPNAAALFGSRIRYADWTHEQAFTAESLRQIGIAVGFDVVCSYEDVPTIHGGKSLLRWLLWKVIRAVLRVCWAVETGESGRDCIFSQSLLAIAHKGFAHSPRSNTGCASQ